MERGRGGRDGPFGAGDPFAGFGRLGGAPMPGLFGGGRDPFDDPFFTQPFGARMGGPGGMFGPGLFGPMGGGPGMFGAFGPGPGDGFLEQAPARSGAVITEIDEDEEEGDGERGGREANRGAYVQEPDDGNDGMQGGQVQLRRDPSRANGGGQPQSRSFTYQSSTVTYGGINGAYYTASKTRRSGSDGITVEESKEADTTTKEATHRISRGIHDKGHSVTRKLKSDGKVDSTQILHNLNEDELPGFEESWKGNAGQHLPGWNQNAGISNGDNSGNRGTNGARQPAQNWALPGMQQQRDPRRHDNGQPKPKSSRIIPIS
ncbi:ATP-dependent RNA helicase A isoform X1 [Triticum urartu]|uniref:Glycine-rich protein n=3 Tax=Triticum urartu TaxID=4572 RepID=A0A8R7V3R3_TRIUA|nr:ATP-dependent RNA helicase A isoform X1 [Triticum urartu]XP_048541424.1 ATP-dependent RNA helicase A isoform X1 [Triticum urartu]